VPHCAQVFALTALTVLDLKENHLAEIPGSIAALVALTHLDVSVNRLAAVPDELGALAALEWLSLARNRLPALPAALQRLCALRYIDVHVNHLPSLLPPRPPPEAHADGGGRPTSFIDEALASQAAEQVSPPQHLFS